MLTEEQFMAVLAAVRDVNKTDEIIGLPATEVRIWYLNRDPVFLKDDDAVPDARTVSPMNLVALWHSNTVAAFSVVITVVSSPPQTRCVFRCATGEPQEASCSENAEDFRNCWDAVKSRCDTTNVEFHKSGRGTLAQMLRR